MRDGLVGLEADLDAIHDEQQRDRDGPTGLHVHDMHDKAHTHSLGFMTWAGGVLRSLQRACARFGARTVIARRMATSGVIEGGSESTGLLWSMSMASLDSRCPAASGCCTSCTRVSCAVSVPAGAS